MLGHKDEHGEIVFEGGGLIQKVNRCITVPEKHITKIDYTYLYQCNDTVWWTPDVKIEIIYLNETESKIIVTVNDIAPMTLLADINTPVRFNRFLENLDVVLNQYYKDFINASYFTRHLFYLERNPLHFHQPILGAISYAICATQTETYLKS